MSEGTVRVQATVERLASPPISRWPVKVTIQLSQRNRRGSRLTAKVGRQWLEGVVATSSPPGLIGFLTRMPSQGDPIVLVDGMLQLPTGLQYGQASAAQAEVEDEDLYLPPDDSGMGTAHALSDEEEGQTWDESIAESLQAGPSCTIHGANATCGSCTATERRISGIASNLVQHPAAHTMSGAVNDQLNDAASRALVAMRTAAIAAGAIGATSNYLKLTSGHRSYASQVGLWRQKMQQVFGSFGCTNWTQIEPVVQATSQALASAPPPHSSGAWTARFRQELRAAGVAPQGCVDAQIRAAARAEGITLPAGTIDIPDVAVRIGRKTVATPGSSPHHTGRAVDLDMGRLPGHTGLSSAAANVAWQRQQPWYRWLVCNAASFGFHPYNREPWHWEYTPPPAPPSGPAPGPRPLSAALSDPAQDVRDALTHRGLNATQLAQFERENGVAALVPIARAVGPTVLREMLALLPYSVAKLLDPWHSFDNAAAANRALGSTNATRLAPRLLLTFPACYRAAARRTRDPVAAYIIESLGWLLMQSVATDVRAATFDFWLPPSPTWVSALPNPVPSEAGAFQALIVRLGLIDTTLSTTDFNGRASAWLRGAAGRQWFFETGQGAHPAAQPFYVDAVTTAAPAIAIPAVVNIQPQRAQGQAAWNTRVQQTDADPATPPQSAASTRALAACRNIPIANFTRAADFRGLELVTSWPVLRTRARPRHSLSFLAAAQPAFQAAMRAIRDLGWNDLLFQTAGTGCFRGTKIPGNVAGLDPAAVRRMSNHSLAIAGDFNDFENKQPRAGNGATANGTMDARLVALFAAFNFRWGAQFNTPDPMHFEYH